MVSPPLKPAVKPNLAQAIGMSAEQMRRAYRRPDHEAMIVQLPGWMHGQARYAADIDALRQAGYQITFRFPVTTYETPAVIYETPAVAYGPLVDEDGMVFWPDNPDDEAEFRRDGARDLLPGERIDPSRPWQLADGGSPQGGPR